MLNLLKILLNQVIKDIDSGNSNITEKECDEIINIILKINQLKLNKTESAEYIGVSVSTFDNYIRKGLIPKGIKKRGLNGLSWNKSDLENFLKNK